MRVKTVVFPILLSVICLPSALLQETGGTRRYLKGIDITNFDINDLLKKFKSEDPTPTPSPSSALAFAPSTASIPSVSPSIVLASSSSDLASTSASKPSLSMEVLPKSSPYKRKQPCIQSSRDIDKEVRGRWANIDEPNRTKDSRIPIFATHPNTDEWIKSACPVELITASCYHRGGTFHDTALKAENREFITSECSLDSYNSTEFALRMANRKVLFVFDGISKQFWTYIVCSLRHLDPNTEYNVNWVSDKDLSEEERKSCPRGAQHCRFSIASVYFPKFQTTYIYQHMHLHSRMSHKRFDIIGLFKSYSLGPKDLVVANFGHNFHQGGPVYKNFLRKFADDYEFGVLKIREQMPTLLWMETSPQHFHNSTSNNGYYDVLQEVETRKCGEYSDTRLYHELDSRNRVAEEVMKAASIPILRIAASTVSQYDIHLGNVDIRGHEHMDCTHFCSNAAIFKHWSDLLYNVVPFLLVSSNIAIESNGTTTGSNVAFNSVNMTDSDQILKETQRRVLVYENVTNELVKINSINKKKHNHLVSKEKLSGVYLTTGKDLQVFRKSLQSALRHLLDVQTFFVICPQAEKLSGKFRSLGTERVIFVDEKSFPLKFESVADVMLDSVAQVGKYPLKKGKSQFESFMWSKLGWFFQQVVKIYAGEFLGLEDFVVLDSDLVFFRDIKFKNDSIGRYNYAYSSQWHASYRATMKLILGIDHTPGPYYSGICHHMVMVKKVIDDMKERVLALHGVPMWQMMLNASARETTCRAPKPAICGQGSTLSEYDMYFHYARQKFPETVNLRQLLWANGPKYGMLFSPNRGDALHPDSNRDCWTDHKENEKEDAFKKQVYADENSGYDFIGYHSYAKRRYYELVHTDIDEFCKGRARPHRSLTSCSWKGYNNSHDGNFLYLGHQTNKTVWWTGCLCWNLLNRVG